MKTILDIDDTLTYPSPYQNIAGKDPITLTPAFENLLAEAPLAPYWIFENSRFLIGAPVYYVTGRAGRWDLVTRFWLLKHGFPRGEIIFLNFNNPEQYVQDKIDTITKLIAGPEQALVIDDNLRILVELKKIMPDHHYLHMIGGKQLIRI